MESYACGPVMSYDRAKSYDVVGVVTSYCWVSVGHVTGAM